MMIDGLGLFICCYLIGVYCHFLNMYWSFIQNHSLIFYPKQEKILPKKCFRFIFVGSIIKILTNSDI